MPEQPGEDPLMAGIDQDLKTLDEKVFNLRAVLRRQREEIAQLKGEKAALEIQLLEEKDRSSTAVAALEWQQRELRRLRSRRRVLQPVCTVLGHRFTGPNGQRVCRICQSPETFAITHEPNRIPTSRTHS